MELILKYFPDLTKKQKEQLAQLPELYAHWNAQINVVSRKDIDELMERHVLHSLSIACFYQFKPGTKILDVGCGGGFPGIPLAILFPEVQFYLVDSIGKKIKVVQEVAKSVGLKNLKAEHKRAEKVKGSFDFVVGRAVTRTNRFVPWVRNKISVKRRHPFPNGIIFLKGGDLAEELSEVTYKSTVHSISDVIQEPFFETKKVVHLKLDK